MSDVLEHESISISVVIQGLISEFLTLNDFILKLDVGQFIGGLCLVRSYYNTYDRCKWTAAGPLRPRSGPFPMGLYPFLPVNAGGSLCPISLGQGPLCGPSGSDLRLEKN